ncbi:MAG: GNAT family N-acetyltransferase [Parvularculaceae bacterium]
MASEPRDHDALRKADARQIVDTLIEERATKLMARPLAWALARRFVFPALRYREAIRWTEEIHGLPQAEVMTFASDALQLKTTISGLDRVPKRGRLIIVANHPSGIADGLAVYEALKSVRPDMIFFANRDALRVAPGLEDLIIPVEWIEEKRTRADSRETLRRAIDAFKDERCVVIFPSGRLAKRVGLTLRERPWLETPVSFARKFDAPITPLHITGRNSILYYLLDLVSEELKNMTLFRELINKRNAKYNLCFGAPIDAAAFADPKQDQAATRALQRYVEARGPCGDVSFADARARAIEPGTQKP